MTRRILYLMACCTVILTGCASMSEKECRQADWYARGLHDGREGSAPDQVRNHREACAKVGILPDEARWQSGWFEGVKSYCTPNAAWMAGVSNVTYAGACATLDEATFLRYHRAGRLVHQARLELNQNKAQIGRLEDELKKASKDDDRKRLRDDLQRAERERTRLTAMVLTLELAGPPR
jgi:hypothetical protein